MAEDQVNKTSPSPILQHLARGDLRKILFSWKIPDPGASPVRLLSPFSFFLLILKLAMFSILKTCRRRTYPNPRAT